MIPIPHNKIFDHLRKGHISIHYIRYSFGESYMQWLYHDSLPLHSSLRLGIELADLAGINYIAARNNVNLTRYLYGGSCSDHSKKLAFRLKDIVSLKLLCQNYTKTDYTSTLDVYSKLYTATHMGDIKWVEQILGSATTAQLTFAFEPQQWLLWLAYHTRNFEIAALLISRGAAFSASHILNTGLLLHTPLAVQHHLSNINLTQAQYRAANSLIASSASVVMDSDQCTTPRADVCNAIFSHAYTDNNKTKLVVMCHELVNHRDLSILHILQYTAMANSHRHPLKIFIPTDTNSIVTAFYKPLLEYPYTEPTIHIVYDHRNFKSMFVHELAHSVFARIFYNEGKVYGKHSFFDEADFYYAYQNASYHTIKNAANVLRMHVGEESSFEQMILELKENFNLRLVSWYAHHSNIALDVTTKVPDQEELSNAV